MTDATAAPAGPAASAALVAPIQDNLPYRGKSDPKPDYYDRHSKGEYVTFKDRCEKTFRMEEKKTEVNKVDYGVGFIMGNTHLAWKKHEKEHDVSSITWADLKQEMLTK